MLGEINQTQKVTYCVVPFLQYIQIRQIQRDRKQVRSYQGVRGVGNKEGLVNGYGVFLCDDKKNLKVGRACGYQHCDTVNTIEVHTLKSFNVCYANLISVKHTHSHIASQAQHILPRSSGTRGTGLQGSFGVSEENG